MKFFAIIPTCAHSGPSKVITRGLVFFLGLAPSSSSSSSSRALLCSGPCPCSHMFLQIPPRLNLSPQYIRRELGCMVVFSLSHSLFNRSSSGFEQLNMSIPKIFFFGEVGCFFLGGGRNDECVCVYLHPHGCMCVHVITIVT